MAVIVWEKSEAKISRVLSYDSMPDLVMLASCGSISSGRAYVDDQVIIPKTSNTCIASADVVWTRSSNAIRTSEVPFAGFDSSAIGMLMTGVTMQAAIVTSERSFIMI